MLLTIGVEAKVVKQIVGQSLYEIPPIDLERKEHHTLMIGESN